MPKYITSEDLQKTKDVHGHHWEWPQSALVEKRYVDARRLLVNLRCGICKKQYWVIYSNLKKGLSMCCSSCSRLPTIEKMQQLIDKYGMLWIPSTTRKSEKGRRQYWMKCGGCGRSQWVPWQRFSQGKARSCRSCARRKTFGSVSDPAKYYKHPIMAAWRRIRGRMVCPWGTFDNFKQWSLENGFRTQWDSALKKIDPKKPYSKENCYWGLPEHKDNHVQLIRGS